jgi:uncharacterized delta-60 repeat protein
MSPESKGGAVTFRVGPDSDPDRYVLGVAVGSGAEGILYRGSITTATGVQLDVAIKMLQPRFLSHVEDWHARWTEQVELLRSLQVPGVVPVRDGFLGPLPHPPGQPGEGRTLYLVMNWVEGEPLDEWIRHRPDRDPLDDLKVLLPVAAALDLMHSGRATGGVPIVHRDVKPSNIIVSEHGSVLVDFGLIRGLPTGQRLTGVAGTPGYLAPESNDAGVYSPASDRYGFGAVAHFVVSGFEPPTSHQPEVLRTLLVAVPVLAERPEVVDHFMEMLATDPDARPTGLANWIGQLRRSSLEAGPDILSPAAPRRHPTVSRRTSDRPNHAHANGHKTKHRRIALLSGVLATSVLAVALLVVLPPAHSQSPPRQAAHPLGTFDPTCGQGEAVPLSFPFPTQALIPGAMGIGSRGAVVGYNTPVVGLPQAPIESQLLALHPNCTLNQTFNQSPSPTSSGAISLTSLTVGPTGAIYAAGSDGAGWVVARYLPTGALDPTFGKGGLVVHPEAGSGTQTVGAPTKIIASRSGETFVFGNDGGAHCCAQSLLIALRPDGSPDSAFGAHGIVTTDLASGSYSQLMAQTGDGSLLVGDSYFNMGCGFFTVDKYRSSGKRESSFRRISVTGTGTTCPGGTQIPGYTSAQLATLVPLPGNQFVAIGYAASTQPNLPNEPLQAFLIRFHPNGSKDQSFGKQGIFVLPGLAEPTTLPSGAIDSPTLGAVTQPGGGVVVVMVRPTGVFLVYVTSSGRLGGQVRIPIPSTPSPTIAVADAGQGRTQIVAASGEAWAVARYLGVGS